MTRLLPLEEFGSNCFRNVANRGIYTSNSDHTWSHEKSVTLSDFKTEFVLSEQITLASSFTTSAKALVVSTEKFSTTVLVKDG